MSSIPAVNDDTQPSTVRELHGVRVLMCAAQGPTLNRESDANDYLSAAWESETAIVAIPIARLGPDFLRLETRLAGGVIQKFANYRVGLAIVGDVGEQAARSSALRDFIYESNRGKVCWFVGDWDALDAKLAR